MGLWSDIKSDLGRNEGSYLKPLISAYFFSASFRLLLNYRIGKFLSGKSGRLFLYLAARYRYKMITRRGCEFSYKAIIKSNLSLPHPIGIVIGDGVIIEDDVKIFQHVTLGSHGKKDTIPEYPHIEKGVVIFCGATIIGGVRIGRESVIGAHAFVNQDVPSGSVWRGSPQRIE